MNNLDKTFRFAISDKQWRSSSKKKTLKSAMHVSTLLFIARWKCDNLISPQWLPQGNFVSQCPNMEHWGLGETKLTHLGPVIKCFVTFQLKKRKKKKEKCRNHLLYAGWLTNLLCFQGAWTGHVRVESSICHFPRELATQSKCFWVVGKLTIVIGSRGWSSKGLWPEYKSDKCEVSGRYFIVGGQMAGCRHILTGLELVSFDRWLDMFSFNWKMHLSWEVLLTTAIDHSRLAYLDHGLTRVQW